MVKWRISHKYIFVKSAFISLEKIHVATAEHSTICVFSNLSTNTHIICWWLLHSSYKLCSKQICASSESAMVCTNKRYRIRYIIANFKMRYLLWRLDGTWRWLQNCAKNSLNPSSAMFERIHRSSADCRSFQPFRCHFLDLVAHSKCSALLQLCTSGEWPGRADAPSMFPAKRLQIKKNIFSNYFFFIGKKTNSFELTINKNDARKVLRTSE